MPSTEFTRSRDEWLAEVRRRGERMRRRRHVVVALVGALAMVLPVSAVASFLSDSSEHSVEFIAAGPTVPTTDVDLPATVFVPVPGGGGGVAAATAPDEVEPPVRPAPTTTTTAEVRTRATVLIESPAPTLAPASPAGSPPADDPVIRASTTTSTPMSVPSQSSPPATGVGGTRAASTGGPTAAVTSSVPPDPSTVTWCALDDVKTSVTMEKSVYAVGEPVRGTSTLENRSSTTCSLLFDVIMQVEKDGKPVDFMKQAEFKKSAKVEPGGTFTSSFTWDQRECAAVVVEDVYPTPRDRCPEATPGLFTIYEQSAPYRGSASFQIGT